jgi:putative FmdB family regulatory protein
MPLYEFRCRCGHRFDELVKLGETPVCPSCGYSKPERLFSTSAGVSTGKTRKRAATQARRVAGRIDKEKKHAEAEYTRNYIKDHGS